MPKTAQIPHEKRPSGSSPGGRFFATLAPKKEGAEMESNDTGDLLLMLLDDDLFWQDGETEGSEK